MDLLGERIKDIPFPPLYLDDFVSPDEGDGSVPPQSNVRLPSRTLCDGWRSNLDKYTENVVPLLPLTADVSLQYNRKFYSGYFLRWPEYNVIAESLDGRPIGYGTSFGVH